MKKPATPKRTSSTRRPSGRPTTDALVEFCRALPHATEDIKWGNDLIFSIGGKMFAGFDADGGEPFGFKCSEDDFDALIATPGIVPAPYAARFSWVRVEERSALSAARSRALLRASYELVRSCLPARTKAALSDVPPGSSPPAPPPRRR